MSVNYNSALIAVHLEMQVMNAEICFEDNLGVIKSLETGSRRGTWETASVTD